ncbi:hypothetical protein HETIRDRAFT_220933, partial [Heterobasidion irregulare TC 32-1]
MDPTQYHFNPSFFDNDIDEVGAELDRIPEDQYWPYFPDPILNPSLEDILGTGYRFDISASSESSVSYDSQSNFSSLYDSEPLPDNTAVLFSSMQLENAPPHLNSHINEAYAYESPQYQHGFRLDQSLDISSFDNEIDQAQAELDGKGHSMAWFDSEPTPSSIVGTGYPSGTFSESSLSHDSQSSYTSYASEYLPNNSMVVPMETISSQASVTAPSPSQCVQAGRKHVCMHCHRRFKTRWNLKTHIETHLPVREREKQYGCTNAGCGYVSARKNDLKRHETSCRHKAQETG